MSGDSFGAGESCSTEWWEAEVLPEPAMHRPGFSWEGQGVGWGELEEELGGVLPTWTVNGPEILA